MKRKITIFILSIIILSAGVSAFAAEDTSDIYIDTGGASSTPIYGFIDLSVKTTNPALDLSNSVVTWFVNPDREYRQASGLGSVTIPTEISPMYIKVRVNPVNQPGLLSQYEASIDLTPGTNIETYERSSNLVPISTRGDESHRVQIKTSPVNPKQFQRVEYTAYDTDPVEGESFDDKLIKWTINGKEKTAEYGLYKYVARVSNTSDIEKIRVDVEGVDWDEIELVPRNDPRLRFSDSKAKRIARCASQSLLLIQRDMDVVKRRADMFKNKYDILQEKLGTDVAFLGKTATNIVGEFARLTVEVVQKGVEFTVKAILDPSLARSAKELVALGELITNNDVTARVKYIYLEIEYYTKLINWLNATQYNIQAEIDSMATRLDSQKKRCIDIANEKIESPFEFRDLNEFKKYEW